MPPTSDLIALVGGLSRYGEDLWALLDELAKQGAHVYVDGDDIVVQPRLPFEQPFA